jgi:phage FluMu protein Com
MIAMRGRDEAPQIRCGNCNRLLGKGTALDLSIKCPRCGCINHVKDGREPARTDRNKP